MDIDWNHELRAQLEWHWQNQLRPRLEGLTDDEYFREPVPGCWSVRPRGQEKTSIAAGLGDYIVEFEPGKPKPAPFTTIAWRLAHIIVGIFGTRVGAHFGGPAVSYRNFHYAGTADEALEQLDAGYAAWVDGVRGLGADGLARPCGPAEGPFAEHSMGALVQHIHREVIHHGAEIALLRDLYLHQNPAAR